MPRTDRASWKTIIHPKATTVIPTNRKPPLSLRVKGSATRFIRKFEGSFIVTGHAHNGQDLIQVRHGTTPQDTQLVNIEKIIVGPDCDPTQIQDIRNNAENLHHQPPINQSITILLNKENLLVSTQT